MMSAGYLLLICGGVMLSITFVPSESRFFRPVWSGFNGFWSRERVKTRCLKLNNSCDGVRDGLYQLCRNCTSGQYIRCRNSSQTVETCPKVVRKIFDYKLQVKEFLVQTRFDSYTQSCELSSLTCWRRPSSLKKKLKPGKTASTKKQPDPADELPDDILTTIPPDVSAESTKSD